MTTRPENNTSRPTQAGSVYKILDPGDWQEFQRAGTFAGNASDLRDGYVHLSTATQVAGVLSRHYSESGKLHLLRLDAPELQQQLRFEPSSKGELYPHLYAPLQLSWLKREWPLQNPKDLPASLEDGPETKTGGWDDLPLFSLRVGIVCAVATGLLYFLAFPGIDVWPLSFVTWVPLLLALQGRSVKQATFLAWVAGFTMTFVGFYWLLQMLQTFSGFGAPLCLLFMALLACYQGGRIGLFGLLYSRAVSRGWWRGASFTLAFAVSEFLYPLLFPWYFGATVHQIPALTQVADLGSPIVVGLVVCGINYAITECVLAYKQGLRLPWRLCAAQLAVLSVTLIYGAVRLRQVDAMVRAAPKGQIGIVQANMGLVEKRKDLEGGLRRHVNLTEKLESEGNLDLIVWPETSVAGASHEKDAERRYADLFTSGLHTPTLFGAVLARPVSDAREYALLNSALLVRPGGKLVGSYSKHKLLAFGEYLPLGDTFPILYEWSPNTGTFNPGDSVKPLNIGNHLVSVHICYEDVLPGYVNEMFNEEPAELLVNMTNDAWYGDTTQPWIHLALASFRAIEHRRYFVRSTNSGVSAFMDPAGRVVAHTATFESAALKHEVAYLNGPKTPYERYGDTPWWLCTALLGAACVVRRPNRTTGA